MAHKTQRSDGVKMAPNEVVLIWHIRRQRPGVAKMVPNQVVPIRHIRRHRPGAEMALTIRTRTTLTTW